ncbi:hypothetical protein [Paraburkholderia aromaticivorans]|uniref:hypothetical protein n=1 Tax=Paraburkholderia aromaticivorans TaxID=2026199 RepID=UPI001455F333|nr:hypothetical protein [Paraburkholderia aromaticivorans]
MRAFTCALAALCLPIALAHAGAPLAGGAASDQHIRCGAAEAGHYEVIEFVDRTTLVPDGHLVTRIDVPQASCYPSCRREQVDSHLYRIEDPAGDELAHPSLQTADSIDPARVPSVALQQIDAGTLQLAVRTRGRAHAWIVEADKVKRMVTSKKETTASGSVTDNDPFFVVFNHAALPTLVITLADVTVELGPSELDLNQLPSWLVEPIAPQQLGVSTVYTLKIVGARGCGSGN